MSYSPCETRNRADLVSYDTVSSQTAESLQTGSSQPKFSFLAFSPFIRFIRPMTRHLVLAVLLIVAASVLEGMGVALFYPLIDYVQHPDTFLANPSKRPSVMILAKLGLSPSVGL